MSGRVAYSIAAVFAGFLSPFLIAELAQRAI